MRKYNNGGPSANEAAATQVPHSLKQKNTTANRGSLKTSHCVESMSRLYGRSLRDRLRAAISKEGMNPPDVIEVGELYQFPGSRLGFYHTGWCLLMQGYALFGDFNTGDVIEINRNGVRRSSTGGAA